MQAVCKKKKKNWNLLETQGKKWKQIPPKKYWEWIFFESCSQQWKDNQKHTIKNSSSGKGEIVLHRHWYLICKAPVSFWWSWTNELAPLMIFSRSSSFFLPSLSLSLDIKCCTDFFCVCINNYTQTHSKQLDVEVIYNSSENGDTHIHTNTQVNIHHALSKFSGWKIIFYQTDLGSLDNLAV